MKKLSTAITLALALALSMGPRLATAQHVFYRLNGPTSSLRTAHFVDSVTQKG